VCAGPAQVGETHSIVLKFELSTDEVETGGVGDSVSVFLDPTPADLVEPTPSLTVSGIDLNLDRMSSIVLFHFTGVVDNPGAFDESRVGRSWSEVAILSVPEPSALSLSGLAALLGVVLSPRRARCTLVVTRNWHSIARCGRSN